MYDNNEADSDDDQLSQSGGHQLVCVVICIGFVFSFAVLLFCFVLYT